MRGLTRVFVYFPALNMVATRLFEICVPCIKHKIYFVFADRAASIIHDECNNQTAKSAVVRERRRHTAIFPRVVHTRRRSSHRRRRKRRRVNIV